MVQVVRSDAYAEKAEHQYATPQEDIYERGTIYFQDKDGTLSSAATQISGYKVAIDPSKITDRELVYRELSLIAPLDYDEFMEKAGKLNDPYEEVLRRLDKEQADKIRDLKLKGVNIYREKWRVYPGGSLASHVLGLVGWKGEDFGGRYGLENKYNTELLRENTNLYKSFFVEIFSNLNQAIWSDTTREGDIVTTIEPQVQGFLESKLNEVKNRYNTDLIGGIVMNPKDGSIYALTAKPDFNPNDFSKVENAKIFSNPWVENVYEFGSVVKPLVVAGALDAGVITANTTYNDRGSVVVEKKEIFNFDKKARGPNTTMQTVLSQSLNTGMVFIEQKLGIARLKEYLLAFGIKDKTGIDLPNETSGLVSNFLNSKREIESANAAFGQGIALTPINMVRALASLGNGGNLVTPHVVDRIKYPDGTTDEVEHELIPTKISKASSEEITRMLVKVMDESLKEGKAKFEHFSVAVKTGTAQVANSESGGYYEDRNNHSFFGYFPAYDPEFIVFLFAINPKGSEYAAVTWSDPFLDITKFLLNYYEVAPDR